MHNYQAPADLLKGKVIIVTGAGDGIGKAAALSFAEHGATVVLMGRTIKKLEDVYDEIENKGYPQAAIFPINFEGATSKDYDELAVALENEFGCVDGILHNAAQLGTLSPIEHYETDTWMKLMQVNLNAPYMLTKALIPLLRLSEDASVVFTSSSVGRKGRAYWGAYSVSKFGLEGLMQVLADELDDEHYNIRVNSINPGATRTNMRAHAYPAENPKHNPEPASIMPVYLYLMGKDSARITGQAFNAQQK